MKGGIDLVGEITRRKIVEDRPLETSWPRNEKIIHTRHASAEKRA
jgi:hypothetical protein